MALSVICARVGTLSLRCGFGVQVTAGLSILPWYVAFGPSQRTGILPSANRPSRGFADSLPSPNSVRQHRSPTDNHAPVPVHAAFFPAIHQRLPFQQRFCAAAKRNVGTSVKQLFGNRSFPPFPERYPDIFTGRARTVAFARGHMCHQRSGRGILQLCGRNVTGRQTCGFAISRIVG